MLGGRCRQEVTSRDVLTAMNRKTWPTNEAVRASLDRLVEAGWLRRLNPGDGRVGRPYSALYGPGHRLRTEDLPKPRRRRKLRPVAPPKKICHRCNRPTTVLVAPVNGGTPCCIDCATEIARRLE
jgi:hypothetical protein